MTQVNSFMNGHLQNSRSPTVFGGKVCLTIIIICFSKKKKKIYSYYANMQFTKQ